MMSFLNNYKNITDVLNKEKDNGWAIHNIEKKFNLSDRKRNGYQMSNLYTKIRALTTSKVQEQNLPPNKDS